jgi:hypothetical protein
VETEIIVSDRTKKQAMYDDDNTYAASVILANVAQYGGEGSLALQWARALQRNHAAEPVKHVEPNGQGRLFAGEAA